MSKIRLFKRGYKSNLLLKKDAYIGKKFTDKYKEDE